jgi:cytochrome c peroxidase
VSRRMKLIVIVSLMILCSGLFLWWGAFQRAQNLVAPSAKAVESVPTNEPILPIPLDVEVNEKKVALGEKLFNEPQLSRDNTVSCATCHVLSKGGTDLRPHSVGINGGRGEINAPTVFNSGFNFKQFWDGRAETLEEQIDGPTHNEKEMGTTWAEITGKLAASPDYTAAFAELYPDGIQSRNVKDAIAEFERSLSTPNSRFDRFLRGDAQALTDEEKEGYQLFKAYGCVSCHQGINIGGNMFQKFGVMDNYFADRGGITRADLGRFNVTADEADRYVFKVASLRNVALTPPYFHDGSAKRLEDAVSVMGRYQLGRPLSPDEVRLLVGFLKTLSGEYKGKSL